MKRYKQTINWLLIITMLCTSIGTALAPQPGSAQATETSVALVGSLQDELGCPGEWQPECTDTEMQQVDDNIWTLNVDLPAGSYEYKVALDDGWDENYGAGGAAGGDNITLELADDTNVTFYYDHISHWIADDQSHVIPTAPGDYQSEIGCADDWLPDCLRSWLQDPNGDGIYTMTVTLPAGEYETKITIGGWDENYGANGAPDGNNIPFAVGEDGDEITFQYFADSHLLTVESTDEDFVTITDVPDEPVDDAPPTVALVGSLQDEMGCPGDWQPECEATEMAYDGSDDVWSISGVLAAGSYEYKVALNDGWDENYGAGALPGGDNIMLEVTEEMTVTFYYDHETHWVADDVNHVMATVPGSYQAAIGCPGDWQPDCLRSWLQDPDGDGIYSFSTTAIPGGDYEAKVAIDQGWEESYGIDGGADNIPFSTVTDAEVTFSYDSTSNILTIHSAINDGGEGNEGEDVEEMDLATMAQPTVQHSIQDAVFYFVMPDRFANGDTTNDQGNIEGDRLAHGFDPTDKGFYHGGDLAGLLEKIDYLDGLGVTAIWMTPMFKNRAVQGSGNDISAGYHGYWFEDFTQFDPHFGTNEELEAVIDAAHERGIKVFFDIITNHTADIIQYEEAQYGYRNKEEYPYKDADGTEFDDRDLINSADFPALDGETSFPYTPVFADPADETIKVPAWLNDVTLYHNRGNSSFTGENSLYGDFFGLDDLFTEHPTVVQGMIDIYKDWITNYAIDGFRVDTVKHVNAEFWQEFAPAIQAHAAEVGREDFFIFGEVYSGNEKLLSHYTGGAQMPAVLDFKFQEQTRAYVSQGGSAADLAAFFANDDYFTDGDNNAYNLPVFIGNHDMGRIGYFLDHDNEGALDDATLLARSQLAHAMMFFARGMPVIYYGDEQGFVGDGGDKLARQNMEPSQVDEYNDDDLIGTDATTADDNFNSDHPLYQSIAMYADLYQEHVALRRGAQIHRYAADGPGIYAFSRIDSTEQIEYVVAFNNSAEEQGATIATYSAEMNFSAIYSSGDEVLTSDSDGNLTLTVPPAGMVIYQAESALPASETAPGITISNLTSGDEVALAVNKLDGNTIMDRLEIVAELDSTQFAEVTFLVKEGDGDYVAIGTDNNPPYRVFYNQQPATSDQQPILDIMAIVHDLNDNYNAATVNDITISATSNQQPVASHHYAILHYQREDGDYGDHTSADSNDYWGLHLWGDVIPESEGVTWTDPKPFLGEDDYGRFAFVQLADASQDFNFIVHRGDTKDGTDQDRKFNVSVDGPEIWLKQDDENYYTSQAAAQGYVTVHYQNEDGDYEGRTLDLWGDPIPDDADTEAMPATGTDDFGVYWQIPIGYVSQPVNLAIKYVDAVDFMPTEPLDLSGNASFWIKSGDETIYTQAGAAQNMATIHYQRKRGDYGDASSDDYNDFWGLHTWQAADDPGWSTPRKPDGEDAFGVYFNVDITDPTQELGYIIHRGDEKDPDGDLFLNFDKTGYEVWQLQGADPESPYVLPIREGAIVGAGGDPDQLDQWAAYWVAADTIVLDVDHLEGNRYALHSSADGTITIQDGAVNSEMALDLTHNPDGLSAEQGAKFPHLMGKTVVSVSSDDLDKVGDMLKGQVVVAASNAESLISVTGLQIAGVLDDLYTYDGPLGISFPTATASTADQDVPMLDVRLWAPTAQSVKLHLFADSTTADAAEIIEMTAGEQGVWETTIDGGKMGMYYLYEVAVYVPSEFAVVNNIVTDPYALALSTNSQRSLIVDLNSADLKPEGWDELSKPVLAAPEDGVIYELHVRDFSINDMTVPEDHRGTFMAFTEGNSDGMAHLGKLADAGLSHIHLLPTFDIATINENRADHVIPPTPAEFDPIGEAAQAAIEAVADQDGFNWGYDPYHYTVPEGSYATNPDDGTRILEYRQMIQALNNAGLRVVMDVVYNHTNAHGQAPKSVLDKIVPGYYHRLDEQGNVTNSTCCSNTATEHNMMQKLMLDSMTTWATAYKVDGFRVDLMGHHMKSDMEQVQAALTEIDPTLYLYGEGWNFGEVQDGVRGVNATQLNMAGTGIGTFNDRLRDAVRGGGPFDGGLDRVKNQGFITGLFYDPNSENSGSDAEKADLLLSTDQIRVGLAGNLANYEFTAASGDVITGGAVDYNGAPTGYTMDPQEHIIYVSAHDNETLYDVSQYKIPDGVSMADRVRIQNLGIDLTVLAQGVPFLHAGVDMLRSKSMDRDSYNSGDLFNQLDFTYGTTNWGVGLPVATKNAGEWEVMRAFLGQDELKPAAAQVTTTVLHLQEMLQIRNSSPLFRLQSAEEIQARVAFHNTGPDQLPGLIVMSISDTVEETVDGLVDLDRDREQMVVLFNANDEAQSFTVEALAGANLVLHPVQAAGSDAVVQGATFDNESGTVNVPARTTVVFVENDVALPTNPLVPDAPTALELVEEPAQGLFWFLPLIK